MQASPGDFVFTGEWGPFGIFEGQLRQQTEAQPAANSSVLETYSDCIETLQILSRSGFVGG